MKIRIKCPRCDKVFTRKEWDLRHTDWDAVDVHRECCLVCKRKDPQFETRDESFED